jgi:hypothetical protein
VTGTLLYINTGPCDGCGEPIDYLRQPWYPTERVVLAWRRVTARGKRPGAHCAGC